MSTRRSFGWVALGLLTLGTLAYAVDELIPGQTYVFQGRLERGMVTDPHFYFEVPCGGAGSETARRHSTTYRLRRVEQGADLDAVYAALEPGQWVETEGNYLGTFDAGEGTDVMPTLSAQRITRLPLTDRSARFSELYRQRRQ